jgi:hypothetical protein
MSRYKSPVAVYLKKGPQPLAEFVMTSCAPVFEKQGFARSRVLLEWPEIVGEKLAQVTAPLKMEWPRTPQGLHEAHPTRGATLIVQVVSAFALDMQYQSSVLIERINAHFGWRCIEKIVLKQGSIIHKSRKSAPLTPSPQALEDAALHAEGVDDEGLKRALIKLGGYVLTRN